MALEAIQAGDYDKKIEADLIFIVNRRGIFLHKLLRNG